MNSAQVGELFVLLSILLAGTYLLAGVLEKIRVPGFLAALFVAIAAHYTPLAEELKQGVLEGPFSFLAQIGVLFLLFFIGLQIDLKEMRGQGRDILWCTVLNTSVPFLFGVAGMLLLGYSWLLAFIIGITRMPTAEAVIVPILDEFDLLRTRVGRFIVGAGVLDDVIEVVLVGVISVWIGSKAGESTHGGGGEVIKLIVGIVVFGLLAWFVRRVLPRLSGWLPPQPRNLILLSTLVLFAFGGAAEYAGIGTVVGAVIAGLLVAPVLEKTGTGGKQAHITIRAISYGFLAPVFFFWVGLSVDLGGLLASPILAAMLYLAGTLGKLVGVFIMVPMKKLTVREALVVGVGLDARLTTEIVVAKLLLDAQLISVELFTALVGAASLTALTVPLAFSLLARRWGNELRRVPGLPSQQESLHA